MFFDGPKDLMLYYTSSLSGVQFRSQPFFADWNSSVGQPKDRYRVAEPGVYVREFQHGRVYLNNSKHAYDIDFGACCAMRTPEGELVDRYTLHAKSGMIFIDDAKPDADG